MITLAEEQKKRNAHLHALKAAMDGHSAIRMSVIAVVWV